MSVLSRAVLRAYVPPRTVSWPDHSRLFVVGDDIGWSIDDDSARLTRTARRLGYDVAPGPWARFARRQSVFHAEHFGALRPRWLESSHRLGLSYFHGRPGTPGYPEFDDAHDALRKHAARVDRVQVTHDEMRDLVLEAGVAPAHVFRIPIGVDLERFPLGDDAARQGARKELGLPESAFVVGSFQKDGVGWGDGFEPKTIKGPDTLVAVLEQARSRIPTLAVLLTGPARGYVRRELERLQIPYKHVQLDSRDGLARAYHALDVYLVTSRQEGGPKSVLESMAAGVPLVTTRVGQAPSLVADGENGLIADVDDADALAAGVQRVHDDSGLARRLRTAGRPVAEAHADERLESLWAELLHGFVEKGRTL
ncbi:MAG: glycosyltransferase family 4 protein [Actinobacteria bacterium]|nr:glycosyltransferase family 4 protein [Actinomycetota bacterium]